MKNKRILFFAPNFFGYELEIKKKLEAMGAIVDFYDDRPSNSTLNKTLIRLNPYLIKKKTHQYFLDIIKSNQNNEYDYVFFIKCEAALKNDLQLLKQSFPKAIFILYLYDSLSNIKYFNEKKNYFEQIFSFDLKDAELNPELNFLPLFYLDAYKQNADTNENYQYDLSFIGTAHSDRPKIINLLRRELEKDNKSYYFMLYVPSKIILLAKRLTSSHIRALYRTGHITLQKIEASKVSQVIKNSQCILDIQHPYQTGLTMRTIELLGMNKKFMTTNNHIKEYNFYDPNNIIIINRNNPHFNSELLTKRYKEVPYKVYEAYYIDNWISKLFNLTKQKRG